MKKLNRRQAIGATIALVAVAAGTAAVQSGAFRHELASTTATPTSQAGTGPTSELVSVAPRPENVTAVAGKTFKTYPGALPNGLMAVPVGDGTFIAVNPSKTLPDAANVALRNGGVAAVGGGAGMQPVSATEQATAFGKYAVYTHTTLGKWVVLIAPASGTAGEYTFWTYDNGTVTQSGPADLAETTKAADTWAADHKDSLVVNNAEVQP